MSKQISFRPELKKATSKSNGNIEVLLVVSNASLKGKFDDLNDLLGATIDVVFQPENYTYKQEIDKVSKKPIMQHLVNQDGTVDIIKEEQTALELGDGVKDTEVIEVNVSKDIIDEFIKKATALEFPSSISINPRDVLCRIEDSEPLEEIAETYEMSTTALLNEIEIARNHFAPFADSWNKHKEDIVFEEKTEVSGKEETVEDDSSLEEQNVTEGEIEGEKEQSEIVTEDGDEDGEVDPY